MSISILFNESVLLLSDDTLPCSDGETLFSTDSNFCVSGLIWTLISSLLLVMSRVLSDAVGDVEGVVAVDLDPGGGGDVAVGDDECSDSFNSCSTRLLDLLDLLLMYKL